MTAGKSVKGASGAVSAAVRRVSPELRRAVDAIAAAGTAAPTLAALRDVLQGRGVTWSQEGEVLFPQDRTALIIEVDELIDALGPDAESRALFGGSAP